MQLISDLFTTGLTHVINDDNEEAGTIQAEKVGFTATVLNGKPQQCATFDSALKYIKTGQLPKANKPGTQYLQFNLF